MKTPSPVLASVTLLSLITLAACQADTVPSNGADTVTGVDSTSQSGDSPSPVPDAEDSGALPGGVEEGTNEALAWEALMGPDGEYAASASYQAVLDTYGQVEPYATIKAAEDRHANALIRQLERYGIQVPDNPYVGTVEAPEDLETAAIAWAEGEVANIEMYDELLAEATDQNLIRVLQNLRRASLESHLPAFEAAAAKGGTLDPADIPRG